MIATLIITNTADVNEGNLKQKCSGIVPDKNISGSSADRQARRSRTYIK